MTVSTGVLCSKFVQRLTQVPPIPIGWFGIRVPESRRIDVSRSTSYMVRGLAVSNRIWMLVGTKPSPENCWEIAAPAQREIALS